MKIVNITTADGFVQGSDLNYTVPILSAAGLPQTMTGWTLLWRMTDQAGTEILHKTATPTSVNGTDDGFEWDVEDTDTISAAPTPVVLVAAGLYRHEGWRVDEGNEVCLFKGDVHLLASDRRQQTT